MFFMVKRRRRCTWKAQYWVPDVCLYLIFFCLAAIFADSSKLTRFNSSCVTLCPDLWTEPWKLVSIIIRWISYIRTFPCIFCGCFLHCLLMFHAYIIKYLSIPYGYICKIVLTRIWEWYTMTILHPSMVWFQFQ